MSQVKKLRNALGLTQLTMAKKVGVNKMTIWKWENGKTSPSYLAIEKLNALARKVKSEISFPPRERRK